jgi:hypothetical protein
LAPFGQAVSEEKNFLTVANQKNELLLVTMFVWIMLNQCSPLKLLGQIKPNLVGSIYVRYSIKLLHLVTFAQQTWSPRAIHFSDLT